MRVQQAKSNKERHECMKKQIIVKEKFKKEEERPARLKTWKGDLGKKNRVTQWVENPKGRPR